MVFVENGSFRNLRRLPTDAFRSIPRLPREALPVAASDLAAWYPFRQGDGSDATAGNSVFGDTTDYSATVNGATFQASGGVTDIQTGANSGAFDFDGVDDTLDLGTVADSDQSLTLMAWVNVDSLQNDNHRLITKLDGNQDDDGSLVLDVLGTSNNKVSFAVLQNGFNRAISTTSVSTGTFVHVTGRHDFQTGDVTLFLNGQPEDAITVGQVPALSTQPWRLGEDNPPDADEFLNGTLDDARIYTAALSDSQINQIYLNTKP